MTQNRSLCLIAAGALAALSACSSSESASEEYAQPAASQGDEATPPEITAESPAPNPNAAAASAAVMPDTAGDQPSVSGDTASSTNRQPESANAPTAPPLSAGPAAAITAPATESLRDAQIVQVTQSADQAEIEQATVARNKSRDARVKAFAERMFEQHTRSQRESVELARKANIAPEDSRVAAELQAKAKTGLQLLRTIDKSQFDATYLNGQVQQHQDLLKLLDEQLIPSAANPELKAALRDTRMLVAEHLTHAKELASSLKR